MWARGNQLTNGEEDTEQRILAIMALTRVSPPSSNDPPLAERTAGAAAARQRARETSWRESIVIVVFLSQVYGIIE